MVRLIRITCSAHPGKTEIYKIQNISGLHGDQTKLPPQNTCHSTVLYTGIPLSVLGQVLRCSRAIARTKFRARDGDLRARNDLNYPGDTNIPGFMFYT